MQPHPLAKCFWANLVKFERNLGRIEAKVDLGKIKFLHPPKYSISCGYVHHNQFARHRFNKFRFTKAQ